MPHTHLLTVACCCLHGAHVCLVLWRGVLSPLQEDRVGLVERWFGGSELGVHISTLAGYMMAQVRFPAPCVRPSLALCLRL